MKLGKALATGVAEERPVDAEVDEAEVVEVPEAQAVPEPRPTVPEEVPAVR